MADRTRAISAAEQLRRRDSANPCKKLLWLPQRREGDGGIRLDSRIAAVGKGDSGRQTIVPGNSGSSELIRRITSTEKNLRMPLAAPPLSPEHIQTLRAWIDAGAVWPQSSAEQAPEPKKLEMRVTERDRQHWAFRPLAQVEPPEPRKSGWAKNPIDRFILARLEASKLTPSAEASKEKLIRRLYFTVTGLPPAPEEVDAFKSDSSPEAYERLVDKLLASPRFGERWARHWLDVARYADSEGYNRDADRPMMYRYRDLLSEHLTTTCHLTISSGGRSQVMNTSPTTRMR